MIRRTLGCLLVVPFVACTSENTPSDLTGGAGGSAAQVGGATATGGSSGKAAMTGGATATGGSSGTAAMMTGGATAVGGSSGTAAMTGGATAMGGSSGTTAMTGGAMATGGAMTTGGGAGTGAGGAPMGAGGAPMGGTAGAGVSGSGGAGASGSAGMGAGGTTGGTPTDELPGSACTKTFTAPAFSALKSNPKLPDPFTFMDGTKVMTKADWVCRQKEISTLAQAFIYGPKPPKPETLTATFSGGNLTINMTNAGKTWAMVVPIKVPTGTGPFPAMFDVDAGAPTGVASIGVGLTWLSGKVAAAGGGRGAKGPFYDFYPNSKDTGSLMAWAWAASRIVDGLKASTGHNIDVTKMFGLGCSRNGKTAATMALFDQRIAMVGMQSPGSGTTSAWRIAEAQTTSVQTADEIFGEDTWMGEPFGQFGNAVDKLPIDQHEVLMLAWPRPLIVREGDADSWNCPICVWTTLKYTQMVYEALGNKDPVGFTQYNGGHCASGGTEWTNTYNAFLKHYILPADGTTSTAGFFTEGKFTFDKAKWQDGDLMTIP